MATRAVGSPLDPAFGRGGITRPGVDDDFDADLGAMIGQPDGTLIVAGHTDGDGYQLRRLAPDGKLDKSFRFSDPPSDDSGYFPRAAVMTSSGLITAGGRAQTGHFAFAVAVHGSHGELSPAFGVGGFALVKPSQDGTAATIARLPDGRILAAGYLTTANQGQLAVARLTATGSLDPSFGRGGVAVLPVAGAYDYHLDGPIGAHALLRSRNGDLFVVGTLTERNSRRRVGVIVRVSADGHPVRSFGGGDGSIIFRYAGEREATGIDAVLQRSAVGEKLVVAGTDGSLDSDRRPFAPKGRMSAMARFLPNGQLDPTFGRDGVVRTDFGDHTETTELTTKSGRLVITGGDDHGYIITARYTSAGHLDRSFGGGRVCTGLPDVRAGEQAASGGPATGVVIQPNGRVVAATGEAGYSGSSLAWVLVGYRPRFGTPAFQCGGIASGRSADNRPAQFTLRHGGWVTALLGRRTRLGVLVEREREGSARHQRIGLVDLGLHGPGPVATRWDGLVGRRRIDPRGTVVGSVVALDARRRIRARADAQVLG